MSAISTLSLERLADQIVSRLTVEMEASGRHVHLSRAHVEALFGPGHQLNRVKDLSQPGQFVCAERVTLEGPRGILQNVVVLGPERPESQVEISLTDGVALGIAPPVRLSGDIADTPGVTLRHGDRAVRAGPGSHGRQAAHPHDPRRRRPVRGGKRPGGALTSTLPPGRWSLRRWRCGFPPSFPPPSTSTMTRPTPVVLRRATGD